MADQKQVAAQQKSVDFETFVSTQQGSFKAAVGILEGIFNEMAANLKNVVIANANLAKENTELKDSLPKKAKK